MKELNSFASQLYKYENWRADNADKYMTTFGMIDAYIDVLKELDEVNTVKFKEMVDKICEILQKEANK